MTKNKYDLTSADVHVISFAQYTRSSNLLQKNTMFNLINPHADAHNELKKFADCSNVNINRKPILSKHADMQCVFIWNYSKQKK